MRLFSRDLLKKGSMVGLGNVIGQGFAFLFLLLLAGILSKKEYGYFNYVVGIASLAATLAVFGTPTTITYFLAKYRDDNKRATRYYSNAICLFAVATSAVFLVLTFTLKNGFLVALVTLGYSVPVVYVFSIRGRMQYKKYSLVMMFKNASRLGILAILALFAVLTDFTALMVFAFGGWMAILLAEVVSHKGVRFRLSMVSFRGIREILDFSSAVFIGALALSLASYFPIILLGRIHGSTEVAFYSLAFTLATAFAIIPTAIVTITMPSISASKKISRAKREFVHAFFIVLLCGILFIAGAVFIGGVAISLFFPESYAPSHTPLIILSLGMVFMGLRKVFASLWEGGGKPKIAMCNTLAASSTTVLASLVLIPQHSYIGACLAFTAGWAIALLVDLMFYTRLKMGKLRLSLSQ